MRKVRDFMRENFRENHGKSSRMGRIGDRPLSIFYLSMFVRSAHQVGAAVFLAAFLLDEVSRPPAVFTAVALLSGALLLLADWMRHREGYREVSGVITIGKIFFIGAAFHNLMPPAETMLVVFVIASLGAHAPKKVRHRLLF